MGRATTVLPPNVARADGASIHYLCRGQNDNFCAIGADCAIALCEKTEHYCVETIFS